MMAQQQQHTIKRQLAKQKRVELKAVVESCVSGLPDEVRHWSQGGPKSWHIIMAVNSASYSAWFISSQGRF